AGSSGRRIFGTELRGTELRGAGLRAGKEGNTQKPLDLKPPFGQMKLTALAGAGQPACQGRMFAVCNTRQFVNSMVVCFLGLALLGGAAWGQGMGNGIMSPPPNVRPPGLKNVGIQQNLNQQIPPDLVFTDDLGRNVRLGDYFGKKP